MLDRGAFENTELTSRHYQTSPLVHWVLEIRYKISIKTHSFFNMTVFERLTKLKGFGFSRSALDLICSYLKKRQRVVIINNKISSVEAIITGFPQQVIDGSFFFFYFFQNDLIQGFYVFSKHLKMEKSPINFSELLGNLWIWESSPQISPDLHLLSQNNFWPVIIAVYIYW